MSITPDYFMSYGDLPRLYPTARRGEPVMDVPAGASFEQLSDAAPGSAKEAEHGVAFAAGQRKMIRAAESRVPLTTGPVQNGYWNPALAAGAMSPIIAQPTEEQVKAAQQRQQARR